MQSVSEVLEMVTLDITPVGKPRQTQRDRWMQRPEVMRYRNYADELRMKLKPEDIPMPLSITFYMPMSASWSKKKKAELLFTPHTLKPDLDNLIKAFQDALFSDDQAIWQYGVMEKRWADTGKIEIH